MIKQWNEKMDKLLTEAGLKEREKERPRNFLTDSGYMPENDLLPGLGGGSLPEDQRVETDSSVRTDNALTDALQQLADRITAERWQQSEVEKQGLATAEDRFAASDALRESAEGKGEALFEALMSFAGKQDGRYDALIGQISDKGYRDFAGVSDILADYAAAGDRAAGKAAGAAAIENGGNPDSYAAAQAARKRLDFTNAGNAAALDYYNGQLDRWLATLQAAGDDAGELYALLQQNVDGTHEAATEEGKRGESIFASLTDLQGVKEKADADRFSSLLSHYGKVREESKASAVSPMEIDREYDALIKGVGGDTALSPSEALISLWKTYPTMHDYLLGKYKELLNPSYEFKG
jgi:hypothetical protein